MPGEKLACLEILPPVSALLSRVTINSGVLPQPHSNDVNSTTDGVTYTNALCRQQRITAYCQNLVRGSSPVNSSSAERMISA
mmetsp:Transcript_111269/g.314781  ORF Transcript_111269/g.314781 Transcript_111269/m.314781 type:complete len:82 (+) Transcript_111269:42-287(+)